MKLVVIKNNLREALSRIGHAIGETSSLPILKNFLLEARDNKIVLTATNLEIAITATLSGKIIEEGKVAVPFDITSNILTNLQSERLDLEKKQNDLLVTTDNYEATIKGFSTTEFPIIPKIKNTKRFFRIKSQEFKEALSQTTIASQGSDLRPELNNLLFHFSIDEIKLAATDSFRLAEKTLFHQSFESNCEEEVRILIPIKTAQHLLRVLSEEGETKIHWDENQIIFISENMEFISRISEGNFPDYTSVVPKKFIAEAVVEKQELFNALKLAGVFGFRTNEVIVKAPEGKKILEISSIDTASGENKSVLPAKISGKTEEVGFNLRYLSDGVRVLSGNEVYFGINDEKPAILKSSGENSFFYIVVPNLKR